MDHFEKIQFPCKIRSRTAQNVTSELEKHHLEVVTPERNVPWRTIVHLEHRNVTESLKNRFKTDFTVKYACKQYTNTSTPNHIVRQRQATEIDQTPTKCDLCYVANHEIIVAALGFAKISWSTIQFQFISHRNLCTGQKNCVFHKKKCTDLQRDMLQHSAVPQSRRRR